MRQEWSQKHRASDRTLHADFTYMMELFEMSKPKQTVAQISPNDDGDGRENFFRRSGRFFRETIHELRRVQWPGRKEVVNYTIAALLTCLLMGLLVWVFDIGVAKIMSLLGLGV